MRRFDSWVVVCVAAAVCTLGLEAQEAMPEVTGASRAALSAEATVLRLVKFSGVVQDALGQPRTGVVGITFAFYQEQEGGAPLWLETQNAQLDPQGRYSALLGAESSEGLPLEIFSTTEARWLGVTVQGEAEQPRVLLVSVPYALKAADAERLGGQLAATFVSKDPETGQLLAGGELLETSALAVSGGTSAQTVSGIAGFLAKFTGADSVGNSVAFESGGNIGLGTTSPTHRLDVAGSIKLSGGHVFSSEPATFFLQGAGEAQPIKAASLVLASDFSFSAPQNGLFVKGDAGIGTATPATKLEVVSAGSGVLATMSGTTFDSAAVQGVAIGTTGIIFGVRGSTASASGTGVEGNATASGGFTLGVSGLSASTSGIGAQGKATGATGNTIGVLGEAASTSGIGVAGKATGASGNTVGVSGTADSGSGIGVSGIASSLTGFTAGVSGRADSNDGIGVQGIASSTTGNNTGVFGRSDSSAGVGVFGKTLATTGAVIGVRGNVNSATGIGGLFENDNASGNLIVGKTGGVTKFTVAGNGDVTATKFFGDGSALTNLPGSLGDADTLDTLDSTKFARTDIANSLTGNQTVTGSVSATDSKASGSVVAGIASTGSTVGVSGESASTGGTGVQGTASATTGSTIGVLGTNASSGGTGVVGSATNPSGSTAGVSGTTASTTGTGVAGTATAVSGSSAGVSGRADSTDGVGVKGEASTLSGAGFPVGVFGTTPSITGIGVSGNATALTGSTVGVFGKAASSGGFGVRGQATHVTGTAGVFDNDAGGNLIAGRVNFVTQFRVKGDGDVEIVPAGKGVIVKSPDGLTCRRIGIDNAGALTLTPVACP